MAVNSISAQFSIADQLDVMDLIDQLTRKLSFLIDVGPKERRSMTKLGDRNRAFTRRALDVTT